MYIHLYIHKYVCIHLRIYTHTESRGDMVGSALCKWRRKSFAASLSLLSRAAPRSSSTTSAPGVFSNETRPGSVGPGEGGEDGGGEGGEAGGETSLKLEGVDIRQQILKK